MSLATFKAVAGLPFAEIVAAIDLEARDPVTETQREFRFTNAPSLFTEPGDDPPNEQYRSVLMKGWRTDRRLTRKSTFTGPSQFNRGELIVSNSMPDGSPGPLDDWLSLDWNNQPITIRVGGRIRADGTAYPFAEFYPYFVGVVQDVVARADGQLSIILAGRTILCQQPVVEAFYRAFGGAMRLFEAYDAATSADAAFTLSTLSLEWFGVPRSLPSAECALIRHTSNDYGLIARSTGALYFVHGGGTEVQTSYTLTAGQPLVTACTAAPAATGFDVRVYAGTCAEDLAEVLATNIPTLAPSLGMIKLGRYSGDGIDADVWESRVWSTARTLDEIRDQADGPLVAPSSQAGLVECWKFGDGTGLTARGELEAHDLTLSNSSIAWVSSLEGDDPEQFGGDLLGRTKPRTYGPAFNVPLTGVDQQRHDHQWSDLASADLLRLKVNGAPMVPEESVQVVTLGDITYDDTSNEFVIAPASGLSFHRFVPGQSDPAVLGQKIEVDKSGSWDGAYRVAVDGISPDGLRMQVKTENGDGDPVLSSGSLPNNATIESAASDVQYSYDLETSTVSTNQTPPGPLTADVVGALGATARVSEIFEAVVGETITNDLTFDPVVAVHIATGESLKKCDLLDALARSALGWWIEQRGGGYRLGNFGAPAGTPAAHIVGSRVSEIGAVETFDVVGSIRTITPQRSAVPSWQNRLGYDRSWHVHDSVAGSVPQALRDRLTTQLRYTIRTYPTVRLRWPTSEPLQEIETLITRREDAETFLNLAAPLFSERRRWFSVTVAGLGMLAIDLGDVVFLQHPDRTLGLTGGTLARVVAMTEDTSSDLVGLELYT